MLENFAKILAIITAIIPIMHLFDKAKRFSHKRRFYKERLAVIKEYHDESNREGATQADKNCSAHVLACSDKVGAMEVDYLINNFPENFFYKLDYLIEAKSLIKFRKRDNDNFDWVCEKDKKGLNFLTITYVSMYFSTIFILYVNEIIIFSLGFLFNFTPFYVSGSTYIVIKISLIIIVITIAFIILSLLKSIDAAKFIYDDLKVKYVPKERTKNKSLNLWTWLIEISKRKSQCLWKLLKEKIKRKPVNPIE